MKYIYLSLIFLLVACKTVELPTLSSVPIEYAVAQFIITKDGGTRDVEFIHFKGGTIRERVREKVKELKFKPGIKDGVPVDVRSRINFGINSKDELGIIPETFLPERVQEELRLERERLMVD